MADAHRPGRGPPRNRGRPPPGNEAAQLTRGRVARPNTSINSSEPAYNRSFTSLQAAALRRLRRQRQIERICRIPRLAFELLDAFDRHHDLGDDLDRRLYRYADLDPDILHAVGATVFPPQPRWLLSRAER
jgi:hypothetical protein